MKILKFPLGIRFDFLKDFVSEDDISLALSELTRALSMKDVSDLHIYGGVCPLDARDSRGIYTVVFMNGDMVPMRELYAKLDNDAVIRAMTDAKTPYVQNNVIRDFEDMEFIGVVESDGRVTGGSGRGIAFPEKTGERLKYDEKKTILIAPNTFKGTISSRTAAKHLIKAVRDNLPGYYAVPIPAADGGDGTVDAIEQAIHSFRHSMDVTAPYGGKKKADYLVIDGTKAVIESALASGLALCDKEKLDPMHATSFGTGELILRAAHEGVKDIYVCLGGSATNDCGIGLARALGVKFLDADGEEIEYACGLSEIVSIDASGLDKYVSKANVIVMCDVENPLFGANGATRTFGRQKGANDNQVAALEAGMEAFASVLNRFADENVSTVPGAGAAGGMAAMLKALLKAELRSGAEAVLDITGFDKLLKNARYVITGEGRIDSTSMHGKIVGAVIAHAEKAGVPVAVIAGSKGEGYEEVEKHSAFTEYAGSEENALEHFAIAAEKLIRNIVKSI